MVVDDIEEYFKQASDAMDWGGDLALMGEQNAKPCIGIVTGSSSNLELMMQGTFELKPEYPKVGRDFNTTKIQRHILPASDPLSLHLARQVM